MHTEFSGHDVEYLHKVGVVKFIAPLLQFDGSPDDMAVCTRQWNTRYCAWALFRLLAYVCARASQNEESTAVSNLQNSLLEFLLGEIKKLQGLRKVRLHVFVSIMYSH